MKWNPDFTGTYTIILCFSCHPTKPSSNPLYWKVCDHQVCRIVLELAAPAQRPSLLMISFRTLPERRVAVRVFDLVQFSFAASTVPHAATSMSLRFWWKIRERLDSHEVLIICDGSFAFRHEATWTSDKCRARNTDAHILIGDDAPTSQGSQLRMKHFFSYLAKCTWDPGNLVQILSNKWASATCWPKLTPATGRVAECGCNHASLTCKWKKNNWHLIIYDNLLRFDFQVCLLPSSATWILYSSYLWHSQPESLVWKTSAAFGFAPGLCASNTVRICSMLQERTMFEF